MNELLRQRYDVLASLYWAPCSFDELSRREFCASWPRWYVHDLINRLARDGLVTMTREGTILTRKRKAKQLLRHYDYDIDD